METTTMTQMPMHQSLSCALPTLAARSGKFDGTGVSAAALDVRSAFAGGNASGIARPKAGVDAFDPYFADGDNRSASWRDPV
ncbi:hypothetical protein ACMYYO_04330 [Dermacoccaceae bacterium W4C1]